MNEDKGLTQVKVFASALPVAVKVSWFRNVSLVSAILPKNERKKFEFTTTVPQVELFSYVFFGRIEDINLTFWNQLTFTDDG